MNISGSQCSSGCESGWTMYFDQASASANECQWTGGVLDQDYGGKGRKAEEEEDLSMVSDASSAPPHCNEDFNSNFSVSELEKKSKRKKKMKEQYKEHPFLDDTASSPVLSLSKKNLGLSNNKDAMEYVMDLSQGSSATHYKEKSRFKKHIGFLKSTFAEKSASKEPGGLRGRK